MGQTQIKLSSLSTTSTIDEEIIVGKDVLELVAGAMYADPLTVYREYIQNAADGIDEVLATGATYPEDQPHVKIFMDHINRTVRICDLGAGVSNASFQRRLTAVGASGKRGTKRRGFRGVGRLSGLGYCQELVFRSRAKGDTKIKELRWNGRILREKLRDPAFTGSLEDLIRTITEVRTLFDDGTYPAHFFEVEMHKVVRIKNDLLMNEEEIRTYLSQVAPVPFHPEFEFREEIHAKLAEAGVTEPIRIEVDDDQGLIFHRAIPRDSIGRKPNPIFEGVEFRRLTNSAGELLAVGWILDHGYTGAMPRSSNLGGIRLRMKGIQVGDAQILSPMYAEPRFSSWSVGEFHILHPKITPNGRRDEFEHSAAYSELQDELRQLTNEIAQIIRGRSGKRQHSRRLALSITNAESWLDIAKRRTAHETIRRAALGEAIEHANTAEKLCAKVTTDVTSKTRLERLRAKLMRLSDGFATASRTPRSPGTSKTALAAVSAILSSTTNSQKSLPMAERVLAAIEGRLDE